MDYTILNYRVKSAKQDAAINKLVFGAFNEIVSLNNESNL